MADAWEAVDHRTMNARRLFDVASQLRGRNAAVSVADYFREWQIAHEPEWKPATKKLYAEVSKDFLTFLGARGDEPMSRLEKKDALAYRADAAKRNAPGTVNKRLKGVKAMLAEALQDELIPANPFDGVALLPATATEEDQTYTDEQIQAVLRTAMGEWKGMTLLGIYTGQRLGDVRSMTWEQVDLQKKVLRLSTGKVGLRVVIPLAPPLFDYLAGLEHRQGPIHPDAAVRSVGTLSNQFVAILEKIGIREKSTHQSKGKGRGFRRENLGLSYHNLRHTATTWLYEAGVPEAVVMALIGHKSKQMSAHYTHVGEDALREAVGKMRDLRQAAAMPDVTL